MARRSPDGAADRGPGRAPVADEARLMAFERLDYIYMPSRDVAADMAWFRDVLGGRVVFAIDAMGTRVAMIELESRGWIRGHTLEIPQGPVCSFRAPGGQRLAVYELARPGVEASFEGR